MNAKENGGKNRSMLMDNNSSKFILTAKDVQFMLMEEVQKIEPYLVEESSVITLEFVKKDVQELCAQFKFANPVHADLTFYHIKLVLSEPDSDVK